MISWQTCWLGSVPDEKSVPDKHRRCAVAWRKSMRQIVMGCAGRMVRDPRCGHFSVESRSLGLACGGANDLSGFTSVVESVAAVTDAAISRHTVAFARNLVASPKVPPIPLVHTITAPTAMQNLLPYLPREPGSQCYGYLWQVSAANAAIFATPAELQPEELVHRAIEHGEEHTIKVTEAFLREDRIRPDPAYRAAAAAALHRTPPPG
jgi:hypothetical protein